MAKEVNASTIPCCPELIKDDNCDVLFFTRELDYPFLFQKETRVMATLILGFRLSRCTLGLVLGDPAYTTTLLPGEKVNLFTSDRRSSFTYDSSTQLSYRSEQISEEQYFMNATQSYFSSQENTQGGNSNTSNKSNWDFKGDSGSSVDIDPFSPGVSSSSNSSGNNDSSSTLDYLNAQTSNMRASATQAMNTTQVAYSVSMGDVSTRTHASGQSQDQYESSTRQFSNPNACHAITYIFYRLNKKQVVKFELVSIDKTITLVGADARTNAFQPTITPAMRAAIMAALDQELVEAGILDSKGNVSATLKAKFDFEMDFSLPTAGIEVKGCLDECNTCEPARRERIHLENELLRKQIELLDQSQEYRCCPVASTVTNV